MTSKTTRQTSQARADRDRSAPCPAVPLTQRLAACTELLLRRPRDCAVFLDVDGTLLDLAVTPSSITMPQGLVRILVDLAAGLGGALAFITGRRIAEIDRIFSPLQFAASGVHGAEMRLAADGRIEHMVPTLSADVVDALTQLAGQTAGAFAEPKGAGLAIHYRLAPTAGPTIAAALGAFLAIRPDEFVICPGQKVFEILPAGFTKGRALSMLAAAPPFKGRVPIMIGDDLGDEPAFAVAEALSGFALRVASENFASRTTDFAGPDAVRAWLASIAASQA